MGRAENSVAEALRRAHAVLLEDLRRLDEAARPASGEGIVGLRARLETTQAHIAEHFRFEEQNGYMDTVRKREPRLERAIQQLAEEHRQLAQSLAALIEEGWMVASLEARFRDEVRAWVERVRQHEVHEEDLVQDSFNLDLGAGD